MATLVPGPHVHVGDTRLIGASLMGFGILFPFLSLLPFVIIGLIVALIVGARRPDAPDADPGIGTVRRVVLYGIGFVALVFAVIGVSLLVGGALDAVAGDLVLAENRTQLAVALAFVTVGIPAWAILALVAQRTVRRHPVERRSQARRLYLALVRVIALAIVVYTAIEAGRFLVRAEPFEGGPWGWLLAWAAVWLLHDRLAVAEPSETGATRLLDRLYLYFGAILGLLAMLGGGVAALTHPLEAVYHSAFREALVQPAWDDQWRTALVVAAVGAAAWSWHWLRALARHDARTTLWHTYLFLFGILVGVVLAVIPATALLHTVLDWFFGGPREVNASVHFDLLPGSAALILVGLASWIYHRVVLTEAEPDAERRSEPERIYRYLVAAAGLLAIAAAIATLGVQVIELITLGADLVRPEGWWQDRLVIAVTLLLVGVPLWVYHWYRTQQAVRRGGLDERNALSRRVYVFAILGVAALTALVNLVIVLFQLFEGALEGTLARTTLHDARWSIALVLTAAVAAVYHWLVLREDQLARVAAEAARPAEEPAAPRRRDIVLIAAGDGPDGVVEVLRDVPGVHLQTWTRLDRLASPELSPATLATLRDAVSASEHDHLVLIVDADGYSLVPYAPGGSDSQARHT